MMNDQCDVNGEQRLHIYYAIYLKTETYPYSPKVRVDYINPTFEPMWWDLISATKTELTDHFQEQRTKRIY